MNGLASCRTKELDAEAFEVQRLGVPQFPSPMPPGQFISDECRVLYETDPRSVMEYLAQGRKPLSFELAGPRERIFFNPAEARAGLVTCGGLCPGLNDVIRAIVLSLEFHYGIKEIWGFRYGFAGLVPENGYKPLRLDSEVVDHIEDLGGTILGSSRGPQDVRRMVDTLQAMGISMLFTIGGDGTQRGAWAIVEEIQRRGAKIAVVGVPKTIDNDISFVYMSFGFQTAVSEAREAIRAAHTEAKGSPNGVGLVKLMGRESGFIAAHATLASSQVNFCLVPEVQFRLERLLEALRDRLQRRGHAVIVVAEGAGQDLMNIEEAYDPSGNRILGDIGLFLRDKINSYFKQIGMRISLKYIDPGYMIRSVPANAFDSAFCLQLGHNAVHAAMSGRTNMIVGYWHGQFTHVPIPLAVKQRKKIDPKGRLWATVVATTGQPDLS